MNLERYAGAVAAALTGAVSALVVAAAPAEARQQRIDVENFAALPFFDSPSISPDGTKVAMIRRQEEFNAVAYRELGSDETGFLNFGDLKVRSVTWGPADTLIVRVTQTERIRFTSDDQRFEFGAVFLAQTDGSGTMTQLLTDTRQIGINGSLSSIESIDWENEKIYMSAQGEIGRNQGWGDIPRLLFEIDPRTGESSVAERGDGETVGWFFGAGNEPAARIKISSSGRTQMIEARNDRGGYREVYRSDGEDEFVAIWGVAPDGDGYVASMPDEDLGLVRFNLERGEIGETLYTPDQAELAGTVSDRFSGRLLGVHHSQDVDTHWFDPQFAEWESMLEGAIPDEDIRFLSWSRDRSTIIVGTVDPRFPSDFYVFRPEQMSLEFLGSSYPALRSVELPARERVTYTARDGTEIPAYLTTPAGEGPMPMVILPHGGPASYERPGYDWLAHGIASQGYVVLQPDFRGSDGYGDEWEEAGWGEWGIGIMQHDLTDGVNYFVEQGLVDPDRVCIAGASYGGYATLAGMIFTPEIYACGVAISPVSDLVDMVSWTQRRGGFNNPTTRYWRKAMAANDNSRLAEASPARHAENAQGPILLIHGRDDTVVPIDQSEKMVSALERAGKPVEFIAQDGEDHWISNYETRVETLAELVAFVDRHIGQP
ncbi:MAG: S9 family peptidase [Oceanicaulis sp.]